jgi:hypothetical protein
MYRAFNLKDSDWSKLPRESGAVRYDQNIDLVKKSLESFLARGILDGTKLKEHWFPPIKADIFISHSHNDEESAIRFAGWLEKYFGLTSFIDSCVWGHADALQRTIDDQYCLNSDRESYAYSKRNQSTSHVHMMLAAALCEMLDATECVFFLNTTNSISSAVEAISKTKSPWLFYELGAIRTLRRQRPNRQIVLLENMSGHLKKAAASLELEYCVPLSSLSTITPPQLTSWRTNNSSRGPESLDFLYDTHPENV